MTALPAAATRPERRWRGASPGAGSPFDSLRKFVVAGSACAMAVLAVDPAAAVVILTASGTGNTTAPVDDPGFGNVSICGNGSAVYLGDRWMITANHVNTGTVTLKGQVFSEVPGSTIRLTNGGASGRSAYTDLKMFRINGTPTGVSDLPIAATTPAVLTAVTMIGGGRNRGAFTQWNVNQDTNPWTWTVTGSNGDFAGFQTLLTRAVRWGTNEVDYTDIWLQDVDEQGTDVFTLATTFDYAPYTSESQAVYGDSGGGLFAKNGSAWQLSGLIVNVLGWSGQPDPGGTPVFGDVTFMADLSYYRPQILAVVPEPATGIAAGAAVVMLAAGRLCAERRRGTAQVSRGGF